MQKTKFWLIQIVMVAFISLVFGSPLIAHSNNSHKKWNKKHYNSEQCDKRAHARMDRKISRQERKVERKQAKVERYQEKVEKHRDKPWAKRLERKLARAERQLAWHERKLA